LENALLNLCINARDAMPEGGGLTIETGETVIDAAAAAAHDLPQGEYVSLSVKDTGSGMTPEVMARAFDPFFTTKPLGQGTGLGLSMIYGFARQSGGEVSIASQPGRGTEVSIWLPRHAAGAPEAVETPPASGTAAAISGETILVIDDEPMVRMFVTDVLANLGYATLDAADGAEGLAILRSDARIDLLVTDVGLPGGMNGRQVADAARLLRPELKILFITGYAAAAVLNVAEMAPGMHVLSKPFEMAVLASRIRDIVAAPPRIAPAGD
jgi:CheY-like chemotaxis protein